MMRTLLFALLCVVPTTASGEWTERPEQVWQDGETIHATGRGRSEEAAVAAARKALVVAVTSSLPDLDPDLAARSAVVGDKVTEGESTRVRLDFPARYGKACRSAAAWYRRAFEAREQHRAYGAHEALAQAVWQQPTHEEYVDGLGHYLAEEGYWGSAAMLLDAASQVLEDPPVSLLRNRATVHIWMNDFEGSQRALERLRQYDDLDRDLQSLTAMALALQARPIRLKEQAVMPRLAPTMDAELTVRFAVWAMMDEATRQALLTADLGRGDIPPEVTIGPARFEGLRGTLQEDGSLRVEDRDGRSWGITVQAADGSTSCLVQAADFELGGHGFTKKVLFGGPFPVRDVPGASRLDDGWLRPVYFVDEDDAERIIQVLFVRFAGQTLRIDVEGQVGHDSAGRPGMLACPQLLEMVLGGLREGASP